MAGIEAGAAYLDDFAKKKHKARQPKQAITVKDENGFDSLVTLSEDSLATAFALAHAGRLLFDHTRGKWLVWDDTRWKIEETRLAFDWVRRFCRNLNGKGIEKWSKAATFSSVERLASTDRRFAKTVNDFDLDPWLIASPGGVVNLTTGALKPASPEQLLTKSEVAPVV